MDAEVTRRQLETCIQEAFEAGGWDRRHVFWRLQGESDGWCLECTDRDALTRLGKVAGAVRPDARLRVSFLPGESLRSSRAWVRASVADVRKHPAHHAEQTTQALQGEILEVLLHEDGWMLVRLSDEYLGWLRDWHVLPVSREETEAFLQRANGRVAWPLVTLRESPDPGARPCGESILGTRVVRQESQAGWSAVELPGARRGWVPAEALREGAASWLPEVSGILAMLRGFVGIPYVWGGKSPKGFDCSGLVQFVYGLHGIALPRDSDQQFQRGQAVDVFEPGDLLFFGAEHITHVAVSLGGDAFIHARGEVRYNGLLEGGPLYAPDLAAILRGGRRVLPQNR